MKILQVVAPDTAVIRNVPIPQPGSGEVLMRVDAVTTCPQWDLHLRHDEPMFVGHRFTYPYTPGQPGHEATGVVEAVGDGVVSVRSGDRVSAWRDPGHDRLGCYAQYAVHQADNVIRVPPDLPPDALAPVELAMCVGTVFRMLRDMDALDGRPVGITGLGPAGLIALQMALAEDAAEVYGFDPLPARRELAVHLGARECFDPGGVPPERFPLRPAGAGLDTSIDCVGARSSVDLTMDLTASVVALFGVQREDYVFAPRHAGLRLCGYQGHFRESAEYAVALIERGKLDLSPLVTHRLPLEHYGEGIDLLESRKALKVCFLPWEEP